ncbi:hypothetical protein [Paenibacillus marinisediminis]
MRNLAVAILLSMLLVGCSQDKPVQTEFLSYANQSEYIISEQYVRAPFDVQYSFPEASFPLKQEWRALNIKSERASKRSFYFAYNRDDNRLEPINKKYYNTLTLQEIQQDLYELSLYLIVEDNEKSTETDKRLIGSFEWSRPLPESLHHRPYIFVGAEGELTYEIDYASLHGRIKPVFTTLHDGMGWQGEMAGEVPLFGTFSIRAFQNSATEIKYEQFCYLLPVHNEIKSSYQARFKDGELRVLQLGRTPLPYVNVEID